MTYDKNKEKSDIERIKELMAKSLKPYETFNFRCQECGNCCRNRQTPIAVMGYDVYNIAKALDMEVKDVILKKVEVERTEEKPFPMVYLKERLDGSCSLLRKGKCMVHSDKPIVCRVYPLGRFCVSGKFYYFSQGITCGGSNTDNEIRLEEWLKLFNIEEIDEECKLWTKMYVCCARHLDDLQKMKNPDIERIKNFSDIILMVCYLMFDTKKSLMENIQNNFEMLKQTIPQIKKIEKDYDKQDFNSL